jgi:hypothetical protein
MHCPFGGMGGNDSLLFTRTDFARGTSVVDLAYRAATAVCRAVVAVVTGTGERICALFVSGFGNELDANRTAGALFITLGS